MGGSPSTRRTVRGDRSLKVKTLLASTFLLLAVAACSGAGGGATKPPAATASPNLPGAAAPSSLPGAPTPPGSSAPSIPAVPTAVHVLDFKLDPKALTVKGAVSLAVTNDGPTVHNVSIRDASGTLVGATKDLEPGQSETLTVDIPAARTSCSARCPGTRVSASRAP